ncbi:MAG: thioesterase family protein [Saprospiraceae bacterium]|nr:thioesterase family protein [Saprospiraceae bacterium]
MTEHAFTGRFPHTTTVPVAWGDMDALGHVNNSVYFRYFETARIHYFEALGINLPTTNTAMGPILAHIACQFSAPVSYPDTLIIGSRIHTFGTTSLRLAHEIYSQQQQRIVATSDSVIVMINYKAMVKVTIPGALRDAIERFQGRQQD